MKLAEAIYHIIYNEIWKLFKRSMGELRTQDYITEIQKTSQIIADKIEGARLASQREIEGQVTQEIHKLVDKAKSLNKKLGSKDEKK